MSDVRRALSVSHGDMQARATAQHGQFGALDGNTTTQWKTLDKAVDQAGFDTGVAA